MNDADLSQQLPTGSEPEIPTAEPYAAGDIEPPATPEDGTSYLWRPMEPQAPLVEPAPAPSQPKLIPNLGHSLVFFALLVPAFIGGWIVTFGFLRILLRTLPTQTVIFRVGHEVRYAIGAQAIAYGIQWALAALVFSLWWGRSLARGVHWNIAAAGRWFLRLALLGVATGLVITLAGNFLPMPKAPPILKDLTNSTMGAWMLMAFGITLAPLTEELAFRGFLLPSLVNVFRWLERRGAMSATSVRAVGIPVAIVLTSIPFAMVHAQQVSGSWGPLLLIGMVSVILCIIRLATDSVAAGFIVHACYNLTLFAGLLVQTDGFRHLGKLKG
ncbi:MAG TPA: CPBP family intramembrane glutamic endopeptidase [Acidobacteriaceae bacterium]|nr:CPBP family intramembrane glutamic endopeptidase [Acidobacteriaceae bacterium]